MKVRALTHGGSTVETKWVARERERGGRLRAFLNSEKMDAEPMRAAIATINTYRHDRQNRKTRDDSMLEN